MLAIKSTGNPVIAEVTLPIDLSELAVKQDDKSSMVSNIIHDFRFGFKRDHGFVMVCLEVMKYREMRLYWHFTTKEEVTWVSLEKKWTPPPVRVPSYRMYPRY